MKTNFSRLCAMVATMAMIITLAGTASAAPPEVTAQLDRANIALGDIAQLTLSVSGGSADDISPPVVPGLEFVASGQSSQFQSINGVDTSTTSVTYEVIPQRAGTFTIPAFSPGSPSLALYVQSGTGGGGAAMGNSSGASSLPPPAASGLSSGATHVAPGGAAFVRLGLPKHELYVGETVPVEIQLWLRPELVASLDGIPTLNGDSFTLNKLTPKPEQTQDVAGGNPYTVLTWHSVLAAVKPGNFSLTVETPLTVKMRVARTQMPGGMFGDSMLNDPFFQNFFGGTSEKQITVASDPEALKVLELPGAGRPAGFSGAVGKFAVSSELSAAKCTAGDPLTLRLKITGTGSFDRVNSTMLGAVNGWKTYPTTAKFTPADNAGYGGEKDFEQAVIPLQPGQQTAPALAFSFFNPDTRRYETKETSPLGVEVSPTPAGGLAGSPPSAASAMPPSEASRDGLRPDHVEAGGKVATLCPLYFQPWFLGVQGALVLGFAGGLIWMRRGERCASDTDGARCRESSIAISIYLAEMDAASRAGDASLFFQSARTALQQQMAGRWHVAPASITIAEIDAHLNGDGAEIRRVFALADQAAYSGQHLSTADFQQWKDIVRNQLNDKEKL